MNPILVLGKHAHALGIIRAFADTDADVYLAHSDKLYQYLEGAI